MTLLPVPRGPPAGHRSHIFTPARPARPVPNLARCRGPSIGHAIDDSTSHTLAMALRSLLYWGLCACAWRASGAHITRSGGAGDDGANPEIQLCVY